jgi:hypothetical protein
MTDGRSNMESTLVALADGSLPPADRELALAKIGGSPELSNALATQREAVELINSVQVNAPASLHEQVSSLIRCAQSSPMTSRRRTRRRAIGALGITAAAVLAVLIESLGSSPAGRPTLAQISALTLAPARLPAAAESQTNRTELAASVQGVAFPYWNKRFGWHATGSRNDRIAGRPVTTVFYESPRGRRIGYAIVSGNAPSTHGGRVLWRHGVKYRVMLSAGITTITWRRSDHLCVVSGRAVNGATLLRLASWNDHEQAA